MSVDGIAYLNQQSNNTSLLDKFIQKHDTVFVGRVLDINLNNDSKLWEITGGWKGIGAIQFQMNNIPTSKKISSKTSNVNIAYPLLPYLKNYPLVNEKALIFKLPSTSQAAATGDFIYYYLNPISLWNHPHQNGYPDVYDSKSERSPSQQKSYQEIEAGNVRRSNSTSYDIDLNGESGGNFVEQSNIHPLLSYAGDNIFEGRFSNSIRLGSTAKQSGGIQNNWSKTGNEGSPITIIRNGQPISGSSEGWLPITEDINKDLTSFYLTSTQKIPIEVSVAKEDAGEGATVPFSAVISNTPTSPKSFKNPQIILNSGRLLFNTTVDSILFSSQKSIVLESNEDLGIKSRKGNVNIVATDGLISIGKPNAVESVILGDSFIAQFEILLDNLEILCKAINKEPKIPMAASQALFVLGAIQKMKPLLPSTLSNFIKTV